MECGFYNLYTVVCRALQKYVLISLDMQEIGFKVFASIISKNSNQGTKDWYFGQNGTLIVENKFFTDLIGAYAVTFGNVIVIDPTIYGSSSPANPQMILDEEYAHTLQYGQYGLLFYPLYLFDWIIHNFDYNQMYFERQAKKR